MNSKSIITLTFAISGATALMYEIAWSRSLQVIFGSTVYTASTVFAALLFGYALGAYVARNIASKSEKPLPMIGYLEIAIGIYGLLSPLFIKAVYALNIHAPENIFIKIILSALPIIIPAMFFGALWPLASKLYLHTKKEQADSDFVIGKLTFANSLGAALGALIAGFILIPSFGFITTTILTSVISVVLGLYISFYERA